MATTKGPLGSLDASGKLADVLVFSKWKGRPYARRLVTPTDPKSDAQLANRAVVRFLSGEWGKPLNYPWNANWDAPAQPTQITPFNAYQAFNLLRATQDQAPTIDPVQTAGGTLSTFSVQLFPTGGKGIIVWAWTISLLDEGWGCEIHFSKTSGFTPAHNNLRLIIPSGAIGAHTYTQTDVPPGTWFSRMYKTTTFARKVGPLAEQTSTVT